MIDSRSKRARRSRQPELDGVRAVAALAILMFHAATVTHDDHRSPAGIYLTQLDLAVPIFFVLSGYLLYRPFVAAHLDTTAAPSVARYAWRRVARILPAYWLALTVTVYVLHQTRIATFGDFVIFYGLLQIYSGAHVLGGLVQAWSLCTEVAFYAFLPVYATVLRRWNRRASAKCECIGLVALYAVSVVFRLWLLHNGAHIGYAFLPAYADVFALGMGLAVVSVIVEPGDRQHPIARVFIGSPVLVVAAALTLFWVVANLGIPFGFEPLTTAQYMERQFLGGLIAVLLVGTAVFAGPSALPNRILGCAPLRWLGIISYGIYLWHYTVLDRVALHVTGRVTMTELLPAGIAITLLAAVVSYLVVERPLLATTDRRHRRGAGDSTSGAVRLR